MITMDLQYILDNVQEKIINFDYDWTDVDIGGTVYNREYIEKAFTDYWLFYQIGYSTLDEFNWRLRRKWLDKINVLQQKLSIYPNKISLNEYTITRTFNNASDNKYSDTPNQPMLDVDVEGKYLTDRTFVDNNGSSTINETKNEIDKYNSIKNKITNVLYDWIKEFDGLFITDIIIKDYIGG